MELIIQSVTCAIMGLPPIACLNRLWNVAASVKSLFCAKHSLQTHIHGGGWDVRDVQSRTWWL